MRDIKKIILHCSDSDLSSQTAAMIEGWHLKRGWKKIGYHYFIRPNGLIEGGRTVEEIGAHVRGQNGDSIGICLAGSNRFSSDQFKSLEALLLSLARIWPEATVHGHNEFDKAKLCPIYSVNRFAYLYKHGRSQWKKSLEQLWSMVQKLLKLF